MNTKTLEQINEMVSTKSADQWVLLICIGVIFVGISCVLYWCKEKTTVIVLTSCLGVVAFAMIAVQYFAGA